MSDNSEEFNDKTVLESMEKQAVINIGVIGHVAGGKSQTVKAITGVPTQKFKDEKIRNITIRLGYANAKIFKCEYCTEPQCYQSTGSSVFEHECNNCGNVCKLVRHISFTDVPGHATLMETMMNGTCVMDYCMLIESGSNSDIPAPQTIEHFEITKKIGTKTILVCLNKTDLLMKTKMRIPEIIESLRNFVGDDEIPVIPTSATLGYNIDVLCEYLANLKIPKKNLTNDFKMLTIRSFNINSGKTILSELKGGVIGGSLVRGIIKLDDDVVIYPGYIFKKDSVWHYKPLRCKILSINSEKNQLDSAIPGGLIGVQLNIDPGITKDDDLVGQVMFSSTKNIDEIKIYDEIIVDFCDISKDLNTDLLKKNLCVNINSNNIKCKLKEINIVGDVKHISFVLEKPICVEIEDIVTVSNKDEGDNNFINILGRGKIIGGNQICL